MIQAWLISEGDRPGIVNQATALLQIPDSACIGTRNPGLLKRGNGTLEVFILFYSQRREENSVIN